MLGNEIDPGVDVAAVARPILPEPHVAELGCPLRGDPEEAEHQTLESLALLGLGSRQMAKLAEDSFEFLIDRHFNSPFLCGEGSAH